MQTASRLTPEEWGKHYNQQHVDAVVQAVREERHSAQTEVMLKETKAGDRVLEIGCGSGATSLSLAAAGRVCTALDNAQDSIALVTAAALAMQSSCAVCFADATTDLPFADNSFDVVFQAGLLEHFHQEERISLCKNWGRVAKRMISLVPNAASLAYRLGKVRMERKGTWPYGLELPQYSLAQEFAEAGFTLMAEYTVGELHALTFLPKWHPVRLVLSRIFFAGLFPDNAGQGYLLVTIGEKKD